MDGYRDDPSGAEEVHHRLRESDHMVHANPPYYYLHYHQINLQRQPRLVNKRRACCHQSPVELSRKLIVKQH